jgi:hypothetical protein
VAAKYRRFESSGLRRTVAAGGPNEFTFELDAER